MKRRHISRRVTVNYASVPRYDPKLGGEFFNYLTFKLLAVTNLDGKWQPVLVDRKPCLLDPQNASGFLDQVGRNTDYVIHPDEIAADNFVHLINGDSDLATPRIVEEMKKTLSRLGER